MAEAYAEGEVECGPPCGPIVATNLVLYFLSKKRTWTEKYNIGHLFNLKPHNTAEGESTNVLSALPGIPTGGEQRGEAGKIPRGGAQHRSGKKGEKGT